MRRQDTVRGILKDTENYEQVERIRIAAISKITAAGYDTTKEGIYDQYDEVNLIDRIVRTIIRETGFIYEDKTSRFSSDTLNTANSITFQQLGDTIYIRGYSIDIKLQLKG